MEQVHRLALGTTGVRVDEDDLRGETPQDRRVREGRADIAGPDDRQLRRAARSHAQPGAA